MGEPHSVRSSSACLDTEESTNRWQPGKPFECGGLLDRDTPDGQAQSPADERDELLSQLIVKAHRLAKASIATSYAGVGDEATSGEICRECCFATHKGKLNHRESCLAGSVLGLIDELGKSKSPRKEAAQAGDLGRAGAGNPLRGEFAEPWEVMEWPSAAEVRIYDRDGESHLVGSLIDDGEDRNLFERIAACVNFCAGISTEKLQSQKPLADPARPLQEKIAFGSIFRFGAVAR